MASRQVEIVERVFELFNRLDTDSDVRNVSPEVEELLNLHTPDVVYRQPVDTQVDAGTHHGREELRQVWDDWLSTWAEQRSELVELRERDNRVVALSRNRFVGRDGLRVELDGAMLFTFDDDRISCLEASFDQAAAKRWLEGSG